MDQSGRREVFGTALHILRNEFACVNCTLRFNLNYRNTIKGAICDMILAVITVCDTSSRDGMWHRKGFILV